MSLIEVFLFVYFYFFGGGRAVVIYSPYRRCENIIRPSGCPCIFSVRAIFDDLVKIILGQLPEIDVIAH